MKKIIVISLFVIVVPILLIGWYGLSRKVNINFGGCKSSYKIYYFPPILHSIKCSGRIMSNTCMVSYNSGVAEFIARQSIFRCLCQDINKNKDLIFDYYKNNWPENEYPFKDAESICNATVNLLVM